MKKEFLFVMLMPFTLFLPINAQFYKKINVAIPGSLSTLLTSKELKSVTDLTLTGVIDQRDFAVMKEKMPVLANVDIEATSVKEYNNEYPADAIPNCAFCSNDGSFIGKTSLKSIILPSSIRIIKFGAFSGCSSLTSITFPSKLRVIDNYAFDGCSSLTNIAFPPALTTIGDGAFYGCSGLINITLPDSLTILGDGTFYDCNVTHCKIHAKIAPDIQSNSFDTKLVSVYVPEGSGESYCTKSYWKNKAIVEGRGASLNLNIAKEGKLASEIIAAGFSLNKVNSLVLEGQLNDADFSVIRSHMPNLVSIDLSATKLTTIPESAFLNQHLLSIILPNGLTAIENSAFKGCIALKEIKLPATLITIESDAFSNCNSLISITLPASLRNIKSSAFSNCFELAEIKTFSLVPQKIADDVWTSINKETCKLIVPKGAATSYMTGSVWNSFMNISESDLMDKYEVKIIKGDGGTVQCNNNNLINEQILAAPAGEKLAFKIFPNVGYSIGTVHYDSEDVTSRLKEGCFTTLTINSSAMLSVNFVQNQYSVSVYTIGTGGVVNNLTTSGNSYPTIYFETDKNSKQSMIKDNHNEAVNKISSNTENKTPSLDNVKLVIDFSSSKDASSSLYRAKAWAEKGKAYVKCNEKMDVIELFSLSGQSISKQQTKKYSCQLDMNHEKTAIVRITYQDGTYESIVIKNGESNS